MNLDETGFMIGVISPHMVVTGSDRRTKLRKFSLAVANGLQLSKNQFVRVGAISNGGSCGEMSPRMMVA